MISTAFYGDMNTDAALTDVLTDVADPVALLTAASGFVAPGGVLYLDVFDADAAAAAGIQEPIAVDGGRITGTPSIQWTNGVRLFRAIPYAAPPVGPLPGRLLGVPAS